MSGRSANRHKPSANIFWRLPSRGQLCGSIENQLTYSRGFICLLPPFGKRRLGARTGQAIHIPTVRHRQIGTEKMIKGSSLFIRGSIPKRPPKKWTVHLRNFARISSHR
jgi:hypothetical protein